MFGFSKKNKPNKHDIKQSPTQEERIVAPGTDIAYKENLIQKYKSDHAKLVSLYTDALNAYNERQYKNLVVSLNHLKDAFRAHILDEELNFYIYLKYCFANNENVLELMTDYRTEMKNIGLDVFAFLKKYTANDQVILQDSTFIQQFENIGAILTRRIEAEENHLYPLYRKPDGYS